MYSSIKKARARPGDWLAIIGAGGGLGHMYAALALSIHPVVSTDKNGQGHPDCGQTGIESPCNRYVSAYKCGLRKCKCAY